MMWRILRYLLKSGPYSVIPIGRFLFGQSGKEYNVGFVKKLWLVYRCILNSIRINTATPPLSSSPLSTRSFEFQSGSTGT